MEEDEKRKEMGGWTQCRFPFTRVGKSLRQGAHTPSTSRAAYDDRRIACKQRLYLIIIDEVNRNFWVSIVWFK